MESRLKPVIPFAYQKRSEIDKILKIRFPVLKRNGSSLLNTFWKYWVNKNGADPVTPRISIDIFGYALNLAIFDVVPEKGPFSLEYEADESVIGENHIVMAIEACYGKRNGV
jgi:hypothetical protein